jgi:hypothetical protein
MPRRWTGRLTLLAIGLSVVIGAVLLITVDSNELDRLQRDVREAAPLLSLIRLIVIASLYLAWPSLLRLCKQRDWITVETEQQLLSRRTRLAMWLIALELILGLEVLNHLHALIDWLMP